jgi:hypothetical protein
MLPPCARSLRPLRSLRLSLLLLLAWPQAARAEPPALYDDVPPTPSLLLYSPCRALPLDAAPSPPAPADPLDAIIAAVASAPDPDAAADLFEDAERGVTLTIAGRSRLVVASYAGLSAFDLAPNKPPHPLPDLTFDLAAITRDYPPDLMDLRAAPPPSTLVFALYLWADDTGSLLSWDAATGQQATVTHTAEPYAAIAWIAPDASAALLSRPFYDDDDTLALLDLLPTPQVAPHPQPPPLARRARVLIPHTDASPPRAWLSDDRHTLWAVAQPDDGPLSLRECRAVSP